MMAEAWGVPPNELEPEVSALWADRFLAWQNAKAKAVAPKKKLKSNTKRLV